MDQQVWYPSAEVSSLQKEQKTLQRGWMFDLDGVLINLRAKKVTERSLLEWLATLITKGELVTFNTGRSPEQADLHILRPLAHLIRDKRLLQRIMLVGEKGGAWGNYSLDGDLNVSYDSRFSVPLLFLEMVSNLAQSPDFIDLLELEQKKTMVTLALREGASFEAFQQIQERIARLLQHYLLCHGLASTWNVDVNGNCVEVEHRLAGKGLGVQRIVSWFHTQHTMPSHMIAFGDSLCDLAMGEELHRHFPVEFIFVGSSDLVEADYVFPITRPHARYEGGTLEYLSNIFSSSHVQEAFYA